MDPIVKEFLALYPDFPCRNTTKLEFALELAKSRVSEKSFCKNIVYRQAVYLLMAHSLTVTEEEIAGDARISSEKAGDVSVSYAVGQPGDSGFNSTQYGIEYLNLVKENVIAATVL